MVDIVSDDASYMPRALIDNNNNMTNNNDNII